jgi:hypothetical protein
MTSNETEFEKRDELLKSEVKNLEKRKEILIGEARRLEAELKNRNQSLRTIELSEIEASKRLEQLNQRLAQSESNLGAGVVSPADLQQVETKLMNAMTELDQALGEAKMLSNDLEALSTNPRSKESSSSIAKVLESLDRILFRGDIDFQDVAPFVICPQCKNKVDAMRCLNFKKKRRIILLSCSFCEAKTRFTLLGIVENMIEANYSNENSSNENLDQYS